MPNVTEIPYIANEFLYLLLLCTANQDIQGFLLPSTFGVVLPIFFLVFSERMLCLLLVNPFLLERNMLACLALPWADGHFANSLHL